MVKLEEEVWSQGLPDDIFCSILAWLPLSSFYRLQCVCKKWRTMSQDQIFLDSCARIPSREPSLFLKGIKSFGGEGDLVWMYEPALDNWRRVQGSFFRPETEGGCSLVTASGGRILFLRRNTSNSLIVCNPFNNTHRMLPPMLDMSDFDVLGMFEDIPRKYYQILVVDKRSIQVYDSEDEGDDDLKQMKSQVYDSRTGEWTRIESFKPSFEMMRILNATLVSESLHCLTQEIAYYNYDRAFVDDGLAVYKIQSYDWEHVYIQGPTPKQTLIAPHILSVRGREMLVAAVPIKETCSDVPFPKWNSVILWELEKSDKLQQTWVKHMEIDLQGMNSRGFQVDLDSFVFLSEGDVIYFGSNRGHSFGMINVHSQTWKLLPSIPVLPRSRGNFVGLRVPRFQTFVFEPRFDLVA